MSQSTETGTFDEGHPLPYRSSRSTGGNDESQQGYGNPRINIDLGKSVNAIALCAAFCGICMAVTVITVWHSEAREVETQARIRVLQNHIDENSALLRVMEKEHGSFRR